MIRFASIPKCASRTLKVQGLLGETDDFPHMPIQRFPNWDRFEWHVVVRDVAVWLASWWQEAKRAEDDFCQRMGMQFKSMRDDLAILENPPKIGRVPFVRGFNSWIPENFDEAYKPFRGHFQAFCYSVITSGVRCVPVPIHDLDTWLEARGFKALHLNVRTA